MMWDLGGGNYVAADAQPQAGATHPGYSYSYPPQNDYHIPTAPSPFTPIGGLASAFPAPSSSPPFQQSYSYSSSYGVAQMPVADTSRAVQGVDLRHHRRHSHSREVRIHTSRSNSNHAHTPIPALERSAQEILGHFQYSRCTGKKKAVCIGINYFGTQEALRGCINDAKSVSKFLINHQHYKPEDIVLLTDDTTDPRLMPTRQNIINAMRWLVHDAHRHDALFLHFSGHGNQVEDDNGDEVDGYDEVIFPVDFRQNGYITDDEMHMRMVKPLPEGCRLTALFDSCHSESVLDLPYLYHTDGRVKGSQVADSYFRERSTRADVISWSGCKDSQTSADTFSDGVAVGAMSHAFMKSLKERPRQTYQELLRSIRAILHDKYSQKPQLSSSHRIDTTLEFIM